MAHAKLSPSSSKRWMNCPGSVHLIEQATKAGKIKEKPSRHAAEGTVAHEIGEMCLRKNLEPSSFLGKTMSADGFDFVVSEEMVSAVQVYVDYIDGCMANFGYAYAALEVEVRCSLKDLEVPGLDGGTSDAVIVCHDEKYIKVVDYKHGAGVKVYAEQNTQAMQYALGALIKLERQGYDISGYQVVIVIVQPRVDWDNPISTWETSAGELYEWCNDELIPAAVACLEPDAPVVAGDDQCKFCLVAGDCPKLYEQTQQTALVDFDAVDQPEFPAAESLTVEQKIQVLRHESTIKKFLSSVAEQVKSEIEAGSVDYRGHFKLVEGRSSRKLTDEAMDPDFSPLLDLLDHYEVFEFRTKTLSSIENSIKLKFKKKGVKGFAKAAKEQLNKFCYKPKGGATLAPASDKRPEIEQTALTEFQEFAD